MRLSARERLRSAFMRSNRGRNDDFASPLCAEEASLRYFHPGRLPSALKAATALVTSGHNRSEGKSGSLHRKFRDSRQYEIRFVLIKHSRDEARCEHAAFSWRTLKTPTGAAGRSVGRYFFGNWSDQEGSISFANHSI